MQICASSNRISAELAVILQIHTKSATSAICNYFLFDNNPISHIFVKNLAEILQNAS